VKVEASIVAGFMGSLNVAPITWVMGTCVAPLMGDTATTAGGANPGACSVPHPATKTTISNARTEIVRAVSLLICFSYSIGGVAFVRVTVDSSSMLRGAGETESVVHWRQSRGLQRAGRECEKAQKGSVVSQRAAVKRLNECTRLREN
jgi:hypothetical protein